MVSVSLSFLSVGLHILAFLWCPWLRSVVHVHLERTCCLLLLGKCPMVSILWGDNLLFSQFLLFSLWASAHFSIRNQKWAADVSCSDFWAVHFFYFYQFGNFFSFNIFYLLILLYVGGEGDVPQHTCGGKSTACESLLTFYDVAFRNQTQVLRLGGKCLHTDHLVPGLCFLYLGALIFFLNLSDLFSSYVYEYFCPHVCCVVRAFWYIQ